MSESSEPPDLTGPPRHHVIFLGAGASKTSGYPVGNELRLSLSSPSRLRADLEAAVAKPDADWSSKTDWFLREYTSHIELFREGGFATVDEFSRLAFANYAMLT